MADEIKSRLAWDEKEGQVNTLHGVCRRLAGINAVVKPKDQAVFCNAINIAYTKPQNGNGNGMDDYDHEPGRIYSNKPGNMFFDALSFLINNMYEFAKVFRYSDIRKLEDAVPDPVAFMEHTAAQ